MTDIAQLGFSVSTGELEKGKAALEAMVPAAARASRGRAGLAAIGRHDGAGHG